jgi:HAD superfamily hydrolase (TIGR01509 family)
MSELRAVLFDFDGVVIDSSHLHQKSWEVLSERLGKSLPADHFLRGFGKLNKVIIPEILGWATDPEEVAHLGAEKERCYRQLVAMEGISALPGVRELIADLLASGISIALATATERLNVEAVLGAIGLTDAFVFRVTADDVSRGKPDPEVFLKAAALCGAVPADCLVIEDAFYGLEAARKGGMKSLAVATTHPLAHLQGRADLVLESLAGVKTDDLRRLWA